MPPFDDVRVRRAVNMAIDKAAIVEAVYQGAGVVAKNPIPPTLWSYNDAIKDYPFDRTQAQRLLVEAGYPDGFETDLWYMPVSRPYNPNGKRVGGNDPGRSLPRSASALEARHATSGAQYRNELQTGEPPMALYGWTGDNGDPDNFLHVLLGCTAARPGGNNVARWCNSDYDDLVNEAKLTPAGASASALYRQAQVIFHDQAPWVPLAHSVVFMATGADVTKGFRWTRSAGMPSTASTSRLSWCVRLAPLALARFRHVGISPGCRRHPVPDLHRLGEVLQRSAVPPSVKRVGRLSPHEAGAHNRTA